MTTVRENDRPLTIRERSEPALRRAADAARQAARVTTGQVALEANGARRVRAVAGFIAVRGVWPTVIRAVQSTAWPRGWSLLTDVIAVWKVQTVAAFWVGFWAALWVWAGAGWLAYPALPALVPLAFGVGRLAYPLTPRGMSRGRFHPDGFASWIDLRQAVSAHAVRRHAVETRPELARRATLPGASVPSAWLIARLPVTDCGTWVGNTAVGPAFRVRCYTAHEGGVGIVGPPRKIKTSTMTTQIAEAGRRPVISLQTKASTWHDTRVLRGDLGPVDLIDPEGLTGHLSTFRWAPERGCANPRVAQERAGAFITAAVKLGSDDGPWLASQAANVLRAFLLIADITAKTMVDIYEWSTSVDAARRALKLMDDHADRVPNGWISAVAGVLENKATRTTGAVWYALSEAVGFMGDPAAAELCLPRDGDRPFDVRAFLARCGTVYLVASDREQAKVGPLLAAFTAYVVEEAMRIAGPLERGHLEPFLLVSADEAANTIPLPLPRWMTDTGGRGIQVVWSAQSRSQLRERWGEHGADTVWNATTTKLIAGGITVDADLEELSKHAGTRTDWEDGKPVEVPALGYSDARRIPRWHAALLHDDMRLTIVRVPPPWRRPDIIAGRLRGKLQAPEDRPVVIDAPSGVPALAGGH